MCGELREPHLVQSDRWYCKCKVVHFLKGTLRLIRDELFTSIGPWPAIIPLLTIVPWPATAWWLSTVLDRPEAGNNLLTGNDCLWPTASPAHARTKTRNCSLADKTLLVTGDCPMNPMAEENIYGTEKRKYSTEVDYLYYCCPHLVPLLRYIIPMLQFAV